jgi:hypothetical protein
MTDNSQTTDQVLLSQSKLEFFVRSGPSNLKKGADRLQELHCKTKIKCNFLVSSGKFLNYTA